MGEALGISQAEVSRFLGTLDEPKAGATVKLYRPGSDVAAQLAHLFDIAYENPLNGKPPARHWEAKDMLPRRGRALDILSDEFDPVLLEALKSYAPPAGHEKWTTARWLIHLISIKNAWDSRALELPGVTRQ